MISNHILFQFFNFSELKQIMGVRRWCGQGYRREGEEGVGHISIKIELTAFCMHLTLFNQVQVDGPVEFCYLSVYGADLSECTYFIF